MNWHHVSTVHFRYVRINEGDAHEFSWSGGAYRVSFSSADFSPGEGLILHRHGGKTYEPVPISLLTWLTLYFGEDALDPRQRRDIAHNWTRGKFTFNAKRFDSFIKRVPRYPLRSDPQWKQHLFDRALSYYLHATRLGVYSMPVPLGLFGLSLECLGNYQHGSRDKYFTLGEKRFVSIFQKALIRAKRNDSTRAQVRRFEKHVLQDIDLLHQLRNAFYGHSLLHLRKDRVAVAHAMRTWYTREGFSPAFARRSFPILRLQEAMTKEFWPLYKLGLRTTRMFLFIATGNSRVPFASHDFAILGDMSVQARTNSDSGPV